MCPARLDVRLEQIASLRETRLSGTVMSPELIKTAAASLKRYDQWQLRDAHNMPEELLPAHFMLKEDVDEIFSTPSGPSVICSVSRATHKAAVVRYSSAANPKGWRYQVYAGKPIRSGELILGKIGCVTLIRSRLSGELEFMCGTRKHVSNEVLAEYLSENFPESKLKFLDRLNTGQPVSEFYVKHMCEKLFIDMADIAFAVPTVYKNRELVDFDWACSLWAKPWSDWYEELVDGFFKFDVPSYNIYFKIASDIKIDQTRRDLHMALGPFCNLLIAYARTPTPFMNNRLIQAAEKLYELGFDCLVSYRRGLRNGEPESRSKLYLTFGNDLVEGTVNLRGYLPMFKGSHH